MERKNSLLMWRARDIILFILSIVGLALLLVYGSKAISAASDRRYVEGMRNRPKSSLNDTLSSSNQTSVLDHVIPIEQMASSSSTGKSGTSTSSNKSVLPASDTPGQKNGLYKNDLPDLSKRLIR